MLVEDDSDDRDLFCLIVHDISSAIECIQFSNGKDALDYLAITEKIPEIIFTDLDMHIVSGEEFIIELKKDKKTKDIPIYAYTTPFMFEHAREVTKSSVAGCVYKTSNFHDLEHNLNEALQKHYSLTKELK
ncbi:response regulator [Flavobacterium suzhouense]|uniref:Response regulator n=1 Tax=Flavobacterium suzhouense TaxID=1529638 RepID=A0ABW5NWL6_9FLAO